MSKTLLTDLMSAKSADSYFRARKGRVNQRAFAQLKRAVDQMANSDLNKAARIVDRVEQLAEAANDPVCRAFATSARARVLHLRGQHREANSLYTTSAATLRSRGHLLEAAIVQKQQVDALTHLGRFSEALKMARSARRTLSKTDRIQTAQLETNVGNAYQMQDRYKSALAHYDLARAIVAETGSATMRALIDLNRANVLAELDKPDAAMELLTRVARTFDRARQHVLASHARYHIAYLNSLCGRYNAGLNGYYKTRQRLEALGSTRLVAWCDLEIAEILLALSAFEDARENAEKAHEKFKSLEMPYEAAKARVTAGLALMGFGEPEEARRNLLEARQVFASNRNTTFVAIIESYLAEIAIKSGDAESGSDFARRAHRVFARQKLATKSAHTRLLMARAAYERGDLNRALKLTKSSLRGNALRFSRPLQYSIHHLIGKIERDRGNTARAVNSLRRAVGVVEELRNGINAQQFKATFLGDRISVYEDAVRACLDQGGRGSIEEAFNLVESAKSRSLADLLAGYLREKDDQRTSAGENDRIAIELRKLIDDLNWFSSHAGIEEERGGQRRAPIADHYDREIARCEREISKLFRKLEASGSEIGGSVYSCFRLSEEFRTSLQFDEAVVEYFTCSDEVMAFVATRDGIEVRRRLAARRDVEQTLNTLRFQIEKFNYGGQFVDGHFEQMNQATSQVLGLLYRQLVAPLESLLRKEKLIVIPHGSLHYVPFHGLLNRAGYLVDQYEISYAPSAAVLDLCRKLSESDQTLGDLGANGKRKKSMNRVRREGQLVAFGFGGPDTPAVESEIRSIGSMFPGALQYTGPQATRNNFIKAAPKARYLHLASHGYFRRDNPMFSFLKLADSNLNFYSLLDLKLRAEIVTLSACHTGMNKVFPGDELHGLMRGFLHAGAPSVIASLWATSDESTAILMKRIYQEISKGASKRQALRTAQLAVKEEYGHPYYWAPFILMGNPN